MLYHLLRQLLEGRHYAYENTLFRGTCAALLCFVLTMVFLPRVIRQLMKWKLGDRPEFDHTPLNELTRDKSNVPTMGGVMMIISIALAILLLADPTNFYIHMGLICLIWLGVLGAVDDWLKLTAQRRSASRDGLKMYEKLLFQVGLGVVLGFYIYKFGSGNDVVLSSLVEPGKLPAYKILSVPFYKPGVQLGTLAFMLVTVLVST